MPCRRKQVCPSLHTFQLLAGSLLLPNSFCKISKPLLSLVSCILNDIRTSVIREIRCPYHQALILVTTSGDFIESDRGQDASIAQIRVRCEDRVCDEVVDSLVLLAPELISVMIGVEDHAKE